MDRAVDGLLTRTPTPDSRRLLDRASEYVLQLDPSCVLGACVCSSVAWGIAGPTSDVDLQLIVPDGSEVRREKRAYQGDYIDHFEWTVSEFDEALGKFVDAPWRHAPGAYSLAFPLILRDFEVRLANAQSRLEPAVSGREGALRWAVRCLDEARHWQVRFRSAAEGRSPENRCRRMKVGNR